MTNIQAHGNLANLLELLYLLIWDCVFVCLYFGCVFIVLTILCVCVCILVFVCLICWVHRLNDGRVWTTPEVNRKNKKIRDDSPRAFGWWGEGGWLGGSGRERLFSLTDAIYIVQKERKSTDPLMKIGIFLFFFNDIYGFWIVCQHS